MKKQVRDCDGILVKVGLMRSAKKSKNNESEGVWAVFGFYKGLVVILRWGCGCGKRVKSQICDLKFK